MIKFILCMGLLLVARNIGAENVPVLIWGNFDHYAPATAIKTYSSDDFRDIVLSHLNEDTFTVVLTENSLSTEDLSLCRSPTGQTCFAGIQQIPSKLYLAGVEDPLQVLEELAGADRTDIYVTPEGILTSDGVRSNEPIDSEPGQFLFVSLQDAAHNEPKYETFMRHDPIVTALADDLAGRHAKNVLFIYTGKHNQYVMSRHVREAVAADAKPAVSAPVVAAPAAAAAAAAAPSAAAAAAPPAASAAPPSVNATKPAAAVATDAPPAPSHPSGSTKQDELPELEFHLKHERLLVYFTNFTVDGILHLWNSMTVTATAIGTVELPEMLLTVQFVSTDRPEDNFHFNVTGTEGGYWEITGYAYNNDVLLAKTRVAALDHFSFHCSPAITFYKRSDATDYKLEWVGLQIEPYFGALAAGEVSPLAQFSDSWDCVGFTSPGIWGGLLVTIMLLIILTIGLSWMMEIRTMDRFDDPKGKTITISTME